MVQRVGQAFQPDTSAMLFFVLRTAHVGDVEHRPEIVLLSCNRVSLERLTYWSVYRKMSGRTTFPGRRYE